MGKNYNSFEEMNLIEKLIADAAAIYLWLAPPRCSSIAKMDIIPNTTSPILRPTDS